MGHEASLFIEFHRVGPWSKIFCFKSLEEERRKNEYGKGRETKLFHVQDVFINPQTTLETPKLRNKAS